VTAPKVYTADDPEPDYSGGAVFAVHYGNYRRQEIWVASGDNIGNLYPLGGEAGKPRIVEDPRSELEKIGPTLGRSRTWQQPPGTIPLHPTARSSCSYPARPTRTPPAGPPAGSDSSHRSNSSATTRTYHPATAGERPGTNRDRGE
jgi:hypothetical protein